jgi:hypothetical protein
MDVDPHDFEVGKPRNKKKDFHRVDVFGAKERAIGGKGSVLLHFA